MGVQGEDNHDPGLRHLPRHMQFAKEGRGSWIEKTPAEVVSTRRATGPKVHLPGRRTGTFTQSLTQQLRTAYVQATEDDGDWRTAWLAEVRRLARELADNITRTLGCADVDPAQRPARAIYDATRAWVRNAAEQSRRAQLLNCALDSADATAGEAGEFTEGVQEFVALTQCAGASTQPPPRAPKPAPKRAPKQAAAGQRKLDRFFPKK